MKTRIYEDLAHLYTLWRDACLGERASEKREVEFLHDLFAKHGGIKTVIDLGGGVGVHSGILSDMGYEMTLFDQSEKALSIAKNQMPTLKTMQGSFETIDVPQSFDASICMWSTLSYVLEEGGQKHFYQWIADHTKSLIVLDEPNFALYPSVFHKLYDGEDDRNIIKITRDWTLENNLKRTKFRYEVTNKNTGKTECFDDQETQQYLTLNELQNLLGKKWQLDNMYGDYDLSEKFEPKTSMRMITVLRKV